MKDLKILLVGCGKMGGALLSGMINAGVLARNIIVIEPNPDARPDLNLKFLKDFDKEELHITPNIIIFAVKPQVIESIIHAYKQFASEALFISIIAGKTTSFFENHLGENAAVIRSMPNLPALVNKGMTVFFSKSGKISAHQQNIAASLFGSVGDVAFLEDESLMDAVTAISGSGPAYLFHFIECLTYAGIKLGLPESLAKTLALKTIDGSTALALSSDNPPSALREAVTSPKGTTEAALKILMGEHGLAQLIVDATTAAKNRSRELSD